METIGQIRASIAEYSEKLRTERIERGLPPEPPEDFLKVSLSIVLAERLAPFLRIAVKYADIVAQGQFVKIDTSKLENYRKDAELLRLSKGFWCGIIGAGALNILRIMDRVNDAIDNGRTDELSANTLARELFYCVKFMRENLWYDAYDYKAKNPAQKERDIREQVERLKADPEALESALSAARAHYDRIKHLL